MFMYVKARRVEAVDSKGMPEVVSRERVLKAKGQGSWQLQKRSKAHRQQKASKYQVGWEKLLTRLEGVCWSCFTSISSSALQILEDGIRPSLFFTAGPSDSLRSQRMDRSGTSSINNGCNVLYREKWAV